MHPEQAQKVTAAVTAVKNKQLYLAFDLYKQLADDGDAESQVFTAWMLTQGIGCPKNESEAARYYEQAAMLGSPVGDFYFGRWLTRTNDHARAYTFYQRGAESKHLPSIFRVGYSLARGKGVTVDLKRAYEILQKAAAQGHAYALREMAILDLRGRRGTLWMPIGILEFIAALCWGVGVAVVNKDSDLLRG